MRRGNTETESQQHLVRSPLLPLLPSSRVNEKYGKREQIRTTVSPANCQWIGDYNECLRLIWDTQHRELAGSVTQGPELENLFLPLDGGGSSFRVYACTLNKWEDGNAP